MVPLTHTMFRVVAYWVSARSTFLPHVALGLTAALTSAAVAPVFFASYCTGDFCAVLGATPVR
jgi:hypothetical protein